MNKLILPLLFFTFLCPLWSAEVCNIKGSWKGIPEGSCTQTGFVCYLGFDVNGEQNVISFYPGSDSTCQSLLNTRFETIRETDDTKTDVLRLSLIESEEFHTDALSMVLASSIALSTIRCQKMNMVEFASKVLESLGIRLTNI